MKILQNIWRDIRRGENIDLYITVGIAIGLVVLNILGVTTDKFVAPVTLSVLGLLAITSLGTRHFIKEKLDSFQEKSSGLVSRSALPPLEERGRDSKEIVIVGTTLYSALIPNLDFFEAKMKQGCKLRFLLLDPESPAVETLALISKVPNQKANIEQSLQALIELIALNKTTKGNCEVRLSSAFLSFGMAGFDTEKDAGYINIQLYSYKTLGEIPNIILKRQDDPKWFDYFKKQFELLWTDSKDFEKRT